jgi:putative membrane protein
MMDWNWGWGTMMFGGLGMLAFWGLLIGLVLWGVRAFAGGRGNDNSGASRPTPLEILQARYARGEISREEYETMRRDLQSS